MAEIPARNNWKVWAHRLAVMCTLALLFMIVVGAMVTTTRAGDTNPGWSWRFWEWIVSWWQADGGRAWEDGHRVIGTIIGFLGIGLAVAMWKGEKGARRWLGVIALAVITLQGVLGGLRVLVVSDAGVRDTVLAYTGGGSDVELRRAVKAMIHGVIGQALFAFLACIAVMTSASWARTFKAQCTRLAAGSRRLGLLVVLAVAVQLALGTLVRQTGGYVMVHVTGAFIVSTGVIALLIRVFRHHAQFTPLRVLAAGTGFLLVAQVFLGLVPWMLTQGNLVSADPASLVALLRTAHVSVGAVLLVMLSLLALWMYRLVLPGEAHEHTGVSHAGEFERGLRSRLSDYAVLSKARLSGLVMVTVAAGYFIGAPGMPNLVVLGATMIGVSLVAAGTGALNQYIERDYDARMNRTRNRPLPSGRMSPGEALAFGLLSVVGGIAIVGFGVGLLAALLTAATSAIYLLIYTPLKRRTTLNTLVGAIPGALPPVIGWAAATGSVSLNAFVLFAILYVWQLPHFWSIAWLYRDDYKAGGMRMLSVADNDGALLARQIVLWCVALMVTSLLPVLVGMAGHTYAIGALALGVGFLAAGVVNQLKRTRESTRGVFFASLLYLPLLLAVLLIDIW